MSDADPLLLLWFDLIPLPFIFGIGILYAYADLIRMKNPHSERGIGTDHSQWRFSNQTPISQLGILIFLSAALLIIANTVLWIPLYIPVLGFGGANFQFASAWLWTLFGLTGYAGFALSVVRYNVADTSRPMALSAAGTLLALIPWLLLIQILRIMHWPDTSMGTLPFLIFGLVGCGCFLSSCFYFRFNRDRNKSNSKIGLS